MGVMVLHTDTAELKDIIPYAPISLLRLHVFDNAITLSSHELPHAIKSPVVGDFVTADNSEEEREGKEKR